MNLQLNHTQRQDENLPHILIVGANERAGHLVKSLREKLSPGCLIEGFVDDDLDRREFLEAHGVPCLGPIAALEHLMIDRVIDCVYVCLPLRSAYDKAEGVLNLCEEAGVPVHMVADFLPLPGGTGATWCMVPENSMDFVEGPQRNPSPALSSVRGGALTPFLTALSAVFFGLISGMLLFSQ